MPPRLLYDLAHGNKPVAIGDEAITFRNERVRVTEISNPHKANSTGRVEVEYGDKQRSRVYPAVIYAYWDWSR